MCIVRVSEGGEGRDERLSREWGKIEVKISTDVSKVVSLSVSD